MNDPRTRGRTWTPPHEGDAYPGPAASTAVDGLRRLLHLVPRAAREGGVSIAEVAEELGVDADTIRADVLELRDRDLHHPPGGADELRITLGADRIAIRTTRDLLRPPKLTPPEALCLWLALEIVRLSPAASADALDGDLRERLRRHLTCDPARRGKGEIERGRRDRVDPRRQTSDELSERFVASDVTSDPGDVRQTLARASIEHRCCVLEYLKPGAETPEHRPIHPYAVVHAEGAWYALGRCESARDVRAFRLDRVIEVAVVDRFFAPPEDFDPSEHLDVEGGRVLGASLTEAVVRYSPAVARRRAEIDDGRWEDDGSFVVRHPVADPDWLVRHVLGYAGEAEVVEPAGLRARVRARAARIGGTA